MKRNISKTSTAYSILIDGCQYVYGWYYSGKAFIAKDDVLMSYAKAYKEFVPTNHYTINDHFYIKGRRYKENMGGIVNYLIDKYNR